MRNSPRVLRIKTLCSYQFPALGLFPPLVTCQPTPNTGKPWATADILISAPSVPESELKALCLIITPSAAELWVRPYISV